MTLPLTYMNFMTAFKAVFPTNFSKYPAHNINSKRNTFVTNYLTSQEHYSYKPPIHNVVITY